MGFGKAFGKLCLLNHIRVIALCRTKPDYECVFIPTDLTDEISMLNACQLIKENHMEYLSILFNVLEEEHVWKSNDLHENIGNKIYRLFDLQDRM